MIELREETNQMEDLMFKQRDKHSVDMFFMLWPPESQWFLPPPLRLSARLPTFGNITTSLFLLLVVSYMVKDRLKNFFRDLFARTIGTRYPDRKESLYDASNVKNSRLCENEQPLLKRGNSRHRFAHYGTEAVSNRHSLLPLERLCCPTGKM